MQQSCQRPGDERNVCRLVPSAFFWSNVRVSTRRGNIDQSSTKDTKYQFPPSVANGAGPQTFHSVKASSCEQRLRNGFCSLYKVGRRGDKFVQTPGLYIADISRSSIPDVKCFLAASYFELKKLPVVAFTPTLSTRCTLALCLYTQIFLQSVNAAHCAQLHR
ncbi:hypothetical protein R1flu_015515 [Riccia fluitans]|uniref:Uncharacterized protein n=1 Tax=Riccia fluitans TaxID=41844 RepID=A0ABD1YJ73_9MARC